MKHFNGLLRPTEGKVLIEGTDAAEDPTYARRRIGVVFQNSETQIVAQTVEDDIAFGPENLGFPPDRVTAATEAAAEALGISHILNHSPHRLSGGEKKKTTIAGVLAMNPELIVFDEPFAGLDYSGVCSLLKKILEVRESRTSVIVITHDLEKILAHADRLIVMFRGVIKGDGPPEKIIDTAAEYGMRVPSEGRIERMSWLRN